MTSPAVIFQGQGTNWQLALADAAATPMTHARLNSLLDAARSVTGPIARPLASSVPGVVERLRAIMDPDQATAANDVDRLPAVSVPGIVLAQIAATDQLRGLGLDIDSAALAGHSQGSLGVAAASHPEHALAFAFILGAAASATSSGRDARSRMLSVRGIHRGDLDRFLGTQPAVVNGPRHVVFSGEPAELEAAVSSINAAAAEFNARLEAAEFGGSEMNPVYDFLPVAYPFHNEGNEDAVELAVKWAEACGIDLGETTPRDLAQALSLIHI